MPVVYCARVSGLIKARSCSGRPADQKLFLAECVFLLHSRNGAPGFHGDNVALGFLTNAHLLIFSTDRDVALPSSSAKNPLNFGRAGTRNSRSISRAALMGCSLFFNLSRRAQKIWIEVERFATHLALLPFRATLHVVPKLAPAISAGRHLCIFFDQRRIAGLGCNSLCPFEASFVIFCTAFQGEPWWGTKIVCVGKG